jgi:gluconate 2-dehydrogenase gamma chain
LDLLNRREVLVAFTGAAVAFQLPAADSKAPLFFTKDEFAMLDVLTELIIPADEHSPGANAAGVAAYIDRAVAEAFLPEDKSSWRTGLAAVNELSQSVARKPFDQASPQEQLAILTQIAKNEEHPQTAAERFFLQLKEATAFGYYSSSIGIHQETNYKGNVILQEFVGYDAT